MKLISKNIILKFITFLFFILLSISLYILSKHPDFIDNHIFINPFLYIALLSSGFILFILSINSSNTIETKSLNIDEIVEVSNLEPEETTDLKEEKINIESLFKKIIAKTNDEKDLEKYTETILSNFSKEFEFVQAVFFIKDQKKDVYKYLSDYAYFSEEKPAEFIIGETLPGQVAKNKKLIYLSDIPNNYIKILSGLGESSPNYLLIVPIINKNNVFGIVEFASFKPLKPNKIEAIVEVSNKLGEYLIKLL